MPTPDDSPTADERGAAPTDTPITVGHKRRRTWPQRMLLVLNVIVILACFAGAIGLVVARHYGNSIVRVDIDTPTAGAPDASTTLAPASTDPTGTAPVETGPPETFPAADPQAQNFLITGADNNACSDPDSPYAGAFGDRTSMGERSDTIMVMRIDPSTKQGAVLSFPRDLWVEIPGRAPNRINSAYIKDDPQRLIDTIYQNFGVPIDHYIQVDFCAFKTIVEAVGGVTVPFAYPARDRHTGLNVPTAGCYTFDDGDHALAYVRSRYYEYQDENGKWKQDPVSDLGRISRQQDFLRRALTAALDKGITNPSVARGLIDTVQKNVVVDDGLTIRKMLEFVGILRDVDPGGIQTYQIEAVGKTIAGQAVLDPRTNGDNMQAILRIFKGEAPLAGAPAQVFESTTTSTTMPVTTTTTRPTSTTTRPPTTTTTTTTTVPETTVPAITTPAPEENPKGIYPPADMVCS